MARRPARSRDSWSARAGRSADRRETPSCAVRNQQVYPIPVRMRLLYSHFVIRQILLLVMGALLTVSCGRQPGVYGAPPQRSLDLGPDPTGALAFVTMDDPQVDDYLVNDFSPDRKSTRLNSSHLV